MKKYTFLLCILLVIAGLVSCKTTMPVSATSDRDSTSVKKDSTWTEKETLYDTIYLPGEAVLIEIPVKCDSVTNKPVDARGSARGTNSSLEVSLKNGLLKVKSKYDSLLLVIASQKETIHNMSNTITTLNEKEKRVDKVIEYRAYWYDKLARIIALAVLLIIIFYIIKFKLK